MYLYILVSLVLALIFACSCHTAIRRHPGIFYGIAFFIILSEVIYYQFGIHDIAPQWFTAYIVNLFKRGAFSTALFIMHKKGAAKRAPFFSFSRCTKRISTPVTSQQCHPHGGHLLPGGI